MQAIYLWLSGLFLAPAAGNLVRVALRLRLDITYKLAHHYRVPLKLSLIIGLLCLILSVVFYLLSRSESNKTPQA